ncbi:hypothetical protein D3C72_2004640 [compost metagenome]
MSQCYNPQAPDYDPTFDPDDPDAEYDHFGRMSFPDDENLSDVAEQNGFDPEE